MPSGPGLSLSSGLRFRASTARQTPAPNTGTVDYAAFQPGSTQQMQSRGSALSPGDPTGLAFWVGAGCLLALVIIRHTLPK
jgi:hypothetical protein